MSEASQEVSKDHPLMIAWTRHQTTDGFKNTEKWAQHVTHPHLQGSLWTVFVAGYTAGSARLARAEQLLEAAAKVYRDGAAHLERPNDEKGPDYWRAYWDSRAWNACRDIAFALDEPVAERKE